MHIFRRCVAAIMIAASSAAAAQSWPAKPIRLMIIFAAGSSGDLFVRVFAPGLSESLGQPVD